MSKPAMTMMPIRRRVAPSQREHVRGPLRTIATQLAWVGSLVLSLRGARETHWLLLSIPFGVSSAAIADDTSAVTANAASAVVAEGAGVTRDEAMKDAYRNAVRQVVGLYVDAESLIKNDELIDDKILTYSDGFITKSELVDGSEKKQGGIVRLKIKATVERKSLVAKLKAANVTVKSLDGESLFAKAITELDAEKNSTSLLSKALEDLPTLLTAEVVGKPNYDKGTSEIVVNVRVQADRNAYTTFSKRLVETLDKIALAKDTIVINARQPLNDQEVGRAGGYQNPNLAALGGPKLKNAKQWGIWVNTFNNASHTTTKWNVYIVDAEMMAILPNLEVPAKERERVFRPSDAKTLLTLTALDADGMLVTEDEVELVADHKVTYDYSYYGGEDLPMLRHCVCRDLEGSQGPEGSVTPMLKRDGKLRDARFSANLYISPYSLAVKRTGYGWTLTYYPSRVKELRFKATLEELMKIRELKCEVKYSPARE